MTQARLFRSKDAGVEPIARRVVGFDDLQDVHAVDGPGHACSVAYVATEEVISPEVTLKSIPDGINIKGLSLEHLAGLLADAAAILVNGRVDMALPKNAQDPIRSLINALSEKKVPPTTRVT